VVSGSGDGAQEIREARKEEGGAACDSSITCKIGILFVSVKYVPVSVKFVYVYVKLLKI
jgi:hypothetical protein